MKNKHCDIRLLFGWRVGPDTYPCPPVVFTWRFRSVTTSGHLKTCQGGIARGLTEKLGKTEFPVNFAFRTEKNYGEELLRWKECEPRSWPVRSSKKNQNNAIIQPYKNFTHSLSLRAYADQQWWGEKVILCVFFRRNHISLVPRVHAFFRKISLLCGKFHYGGYDVSFLRTTSQGSKTGKMNTLLWQRYTLEVE